MGRRFGGSATLGQVQPRVQYLMTVVDALSKYAWVQPLKAKTGVAVVQAFDKILRQGRRPNRLQTDRGKEFYNRTFQQWAQKHGIHHFSTDGDAKAALVERFNRTLKERLSVFHGCQHLSIPRRTASTHGRVQCHASSGHWHGSSRRDVEQRGSRVDPFVREMVESETHPSQIARGGSGASQQSAPHLQERVFARVDRGSVCGASRDPRPHSHLQDSRMGWISHGRHLLQRGFAKSAVGGQRLVSHRKGT